MFGSTLATLVLPIILAHLAPGVVLAAPTPPSSHAHTLAHVPRAEPHEVDALFKRQTPLDPHSPDFASHYPPAFTVPSPAQLPAAWRQRLAALRLPGGCPQASGSGNPSYNGMNPGDGGICSFTYGCSSSEDLKDAPAGRLAISFDDGPAAGTDLLWSYMGENRARGVGTHFMIGSYIVNNPGTFQDVAREGHIGVHTWSHKYTTTLSNEEIVGELGWTMQLMADLNGGRIPRFWRPPYGDVDNRVRAIAKGVFGLETVTWNEDTGDWNIGYNPAYTVASVTANYLGWLGGDKARGLNVLQHELSTDDVAVFSNVLPRARAMGWAVGNVADSFGMAWYQNADGASGPVRGMSVGGQAPAPAPAPSPSPSPSPSGGASAPARSGWPVVPSSAPQPSGNGNVGPGPRPSDVSSAAISSASASASATGMSTVPSVAPSTASSAVQSSSAPSLATSSATQNNQARPSASASVTSGASALASAPQSVALVFAAALAAVMSL